MQCHSNEAVDIANFICFTFTTDIRLICKKNFKALKINWYCHIVDVHNYA